MENFSTETFIWIVSSVLILLGIVGVIAPALPGPFLIVAGVLLHKIFLPQYLSWWTVVGITFLAILCVVIDWVCLAMGVKWSGASKWAILGAAIGLFIGILGGFLGIIIGPVLGAAAGEYFIAKKQPEEAGIAGLGAGIAVLVSTLLRFLFALIMVAAFLINCFWNK